VEGIDFVKCALGPGRGSGDSEKHLGIGRKERDCKRIGTNCMVPTTLQQGGRGGSVQITEEACWIGDKDFKFPGNLKSFLYRWFIFP
jgi:hypothetical protein